MTRALLFGALAIPAGRPSIEIQGFHLIESQKQKRSMELTANSARVYKPENLMVLDNLTTLVWGESQKPFEIRGLLGVLNSVNQDFEIREDSQVLSPDGYIFETKNVFYDATARTITGNELVKGSNRPSLGARKSGEQAFMQIRGMGLAIDINKSSYEIKHDVHAEQKLSSKNGLTIKAANSIIYPETHSAVFSRNVVVQSPNLLLSGERLVISFESNRPGKLRLDSPGVNPKKIKADFPSLKVESLGLVVNFGDDGGVQTSEAVGEVTALSAEGVKMRADSLVSEGAGEKQRVLMKGKVEIDVDKRVATCEEAQYFPLTGDIVLEHVAAVKKAQEIIEGELIRFSTKGSEVFVEKAKGRINRKAMELPSG